MSDETTAVQELSYHRPKLRQPGEIEQRFQNLQLYDANQTTYFNTIDGNQTVMEFKFDPLSKQNILVKYDKDFLNQIYPEVPDYQPVLYDLITRVGEDDFVKLKQVFDAEYKNLLQYPKYNNNFDKIWVQAKPKKWLQLSQFLRSTYDDSFNNLSPYYYQYNVATKYSDQWDAASKLLEYRKDKAPYSLKAILPNFLNKPYIIPYFINNPNERPTLNYIRALNSGNYVELSGTTKFLLNAANIAASIAIPKLFKGGKYYLFTSILNFLRNDAKRNYGIDMDQSSLIAEFLKFADKVKDYKNPKIREKLGGETVKLMDNFMEYLYFNEKMNPNYSYEKDMSEHAMALPITEPVLSNAYRHRSKKYYDLFIVPNELDWKKVGRMIPGRDTKYYQRKSESIREHYAYMNYPTMDLSIPSIQKKYDNLLKQMYSKAFLQGYGKYDDYKTRVDQYLNIKQQMADILTHQYNILTKVYNVADYIVNSFKKQSTKLGTKYLLKPALTNLFNSGKVTHQYAQYLLTKNAPKILTAQNRIVEEAHKKYHFSNVRFYNKAYRYRRKFQRFTKRRHQRNFFFRKSYRRRRYY